VFRISATELKRITNLLGRFVPKRHTVPILDCVHVWWGGGYAEWTATDLDAWLTVVTDVGAGGEGAVCLPHRVLADIAGRVEGEIVFAQDGEVVILRAGRARFELQTMRADEYPEKPHTREDLATLPTGELANALRRVAPCASEDLSRPALTAVCWQAGAMVATDGTRLAVCEGAPDLGRTVLLPGRAAQHIAAMLPEEGKVLVSTGGDRGQLLLFSWTARGVGHRVVMRQIAAPYPDWRAVVPRGEPVVRATVGREKLAAALQRLAVLGRGEKVPKVRMEWTDECCAILRAESDAGRGQETVECEEQYGDRLTVLAAVPLVADGLRLAEADAVEIQGWGAQTVWEIRGAGREDWRYYWLPLRGGN
jgi:DNA polymerase III sliding clamp (beta) subunit (PCNA family)